MTKPILPKRLYHYTTAAGLRGIIEENAFHAGNYRFLNDETEIHHGMEVVSQSLAARFPLGLDKSYAPFQWEQMIEFTEVWVVCFSELRDDLNQWRSYGRPGGDRYCIALDRTLLKAEVGSHHFTRPQWLRVMYTSNEKSRVIRRICAEERIRPSKKSATQGSITLDLKLYMMLPAFKEASFAAEKEWRFVIYQRPRYPRYEDGTPVQFKESGGHLTPYLTVAPEDGKLPIAEVLFLPRRGGSLQCETVARLLLDGRGYRGDIVRRSSIPFVD